MPKLDDRTRRLRRVWRLLKSLEDTSQAAEKALWWRTHSQIIRANDKGFGGEIVALADSHAFLKRQGVATYDINPTMEGANSRHIVAANPRNISELVTALRELFPELKGEIPGGGK